MTGMDSRTYIYLCRRATFAATDCALLQRISHHGNPWGDNMSQQAHRAVRAVAVVAAHTRSGGNQGPSLWDVLLKWKKEIYLLKGKQVEIVPLLTHCSSGARIGLSLCIEPFACNFAPFVECIVISCLS